MQPEFPPDQRALVLAPTRRDGQISLLLLADADIHGVVCASMAQLLLEIQKGAGVVVLTEQADDLSSFSALHAVLDEQESWSELPIIALAKSNSDLPGELRSIPGLVLLERPVQARTLISAVEAGLRARRRQYRLRDELQRIQIANDELARSTRAKDHFLAILAHELRNPLGAMANAHHLLREAQGNPLIARRAQGVIGRQIEQMTRLLDDLLDVSRITTNKVRLKREVRDLEAIVTAAVETARPIIEGRQHRLNVYTSAASPRVFVDAVRIVQVIGNLLTNAAKYTEKGGEIAISTAVESDEAVVTVSDNGSGIPPESIDSVFEMFSQLRPALEGSRGGLGIGLALAKGIVALHQGSIVAHSGGVGQGSTFTMRLPLADANAQKENDAAVVPAQLPSPKRILIADDNPDGLESLSDLLRLEGHTVESARNGMEAARKLATFAPDIALLDIGMPGMNGYELARHVRSHGGKDIKLIAVTGWGQAADKARAQEAGFDHHLTKPVDMGALRALLS